MIVRLTAVKTLKQLYEHKVLGATGTSRYKANPALLDRISLFQGDITNLEVDSIVNAANSSLLGLNLVDGAIHAGAGPELLEECRGLDGCDTGDSKITKGYNLPSSHVIHTVGPVYRSTDAEEKARLLASCYRTSLTLAAENNLKHIAFPSISTGVYCYPIVDATRVALNEVRQFCDSESGDKLERVIFVVWSDKDKDVYEELIPEYFPPPVEQEGDINPSDAAP
ncbi:A1pp-domain-containing protein [Infundibulicybe gibba]|nr:A1pp-domain-containing protein [Infundibulicybe gibba]